MSGVNQIRTVFLDYFARHDHEVVPSSSFVPHNDPTLMFTNAGMVQFKNAFTGVEKRRRARATSAQKCVRAGGKHNDLDNVGYTARHHTFFEMLGNFSFGDYFKAGAIELALGSDHRSSASADRSLLAPSITTTTTHLICGGRSLDSRLTASSASTTNDNFWSMGETGPCGPCSEIFYDQGEKFAGGPPGSPERTATASSSSGTSCSCNMSRWRRRASDRCRVRRSTRAWGRSAWRRYCRAWLRFRDRSVPRADRRGRRPDRCAREWSASGESSRHRRPFARLLVPDRRWRHALQRGPRIRAAADHAPRHAPRAIARRRRSANVASRADPCRANGLGLSRVASRRGVDRRHAAHRGNSLSRYAGARLVDTGRGNSRPRARARGFPARPLSSSMTPLAFRSI